ncbi:hypothetical protein AAA294_07300 [Fusobacterium varium]|uniref:hypothetical protein n=1 Tax=Fusobacterium varium TaxID=856 RepID=UPI0032BF481E
MNRYESYLNIAIQIICSSLEDHINVWKNEIKNNGGFLSPYYKGRLTTAYNTAISLKEDLINTPCKETHYIKLIQEVYDFHRIRNNQRKKEGETIVYDFSIEVKTLPDKFLDSFNSFLLTLEYTKYKLEKTLINMNLSEKFLKLYTAVQNYANFFHKEIIITAKEEDKVA